MRFFALLLTLSSVYNVLSQTIQLSQCIQKCHSVHATKTYPNLQKSKEHGSSSLLQPSRPNSPTSSENQASARISTTKSALKGSDIPKTHLTHQSANSPRMGNYGSTTHRSKGKSTLESPSPTTGVPRHSNTPMSTRTNLDSSDRNGDRKPGNRGDKTPSSPTHGNGRHSTSEPPSASAKSNQKTSTQASDNSTATGMHTLNTSSVPTSGPANSRQRSVEPSKGRSTRLPFQSPRPSGRTTVTSIAPLVSGPVFSAFTTTVSGSAITQSVIPGGQTSSITLTPALSGILHSTEPAASSSASIFRGMLNNAIQQVQNYEQGVKSDPRIAPPTNILSDAVSFGKGLLESLAPPSSQSSGFTSSLWSLLSCAVSDVSNVVSGVTKGASDVGSTVGHLTDITDALGGLGGDGSDPPGDNNPKSPGNDYDPPGNHPPGNDQPDPRNLIHQSPPLTNQKTKILMMSRLLPSRQPHRIVSHPCHRPVKVLRRWSTSPASASTLRYPHQLSKHVRLTSGPSQAAM